MSRTARPLTRLVRRPATVVFALAVGSSSCTTDRPLQHQPEHVDLVLLGWDLSPTRSWIGLLDTQTNTASRVIGDVGSPRAIELAVSRDGLFVATMSIGEGIRVFNLQSFDLVSSVAHAGLASIELVSARKKILAMADLTPTVVYDFPYLTRDTVLSESYFKCLAPPQSNEVIGIYRVKENVAGLQPCGMARISTSSWGVLDSLVFVSPRTGGPLIVFDATLSPDGMLIYTLAADAAGSAVFAFDPANHLSRFVTPVLTCLYSSIVALPSGREVWVSQGYRGETVPRELGHVLILDSQTGSILDTVSTSGLREAHPEEPFPLGPFVVLPDAPTVYLCSGYPYQSLLVIDSDTRVVESVLQLGPIYDLAIRTKP